MRALITAGGRGTRLRPLTHTSNKHLIPIANKPMIHYALEAVAAAGIQEVGIAINPDTGDDTPIFEAVHAIRPSARGELEISDAHQYLLEHGYQVGFSEITGWWKDTGKPEDLLEANRFALDHLLDEVGPVVRGFVDAESDVQGKVVVEAGARVIASHIRGPAIIGADCVVERSYVGPFTSLGPRCVIRDSELEYSILFEDTQILDADVRIERSLLGREVLIRRAAGRPKTQRFILADQSIIELC